MDGYSMGLFLHIVGALVFFVALGLEWTGLWQIRTAITQGQAREWMGILKNVRKIGFVSMLATVITGIYMMVIDWGGVAWIIAAMASLVLVIILSQALTGPRMAAIGQSLVKEEGVLSHAYRNLSQHPLLWISIQTRLALTLGIVFLNTIKPGLGGSLLIVGIGIVLGVVSALPLVRRGQVQQETTA